MDKTRAAEVIRKFLDGSIGCYEWDDFLNQKEVGKYSLILKFCSDVQVLFPSACGNAYCSEEGLQSLEKLAELLKGEEKFMFEWLYLLLSASK